MCSVPRSSSDGCQQLSILSLQAVLASCGLLEAFPYLQLEASFEVFYRSVLCYLRAALWRLGGHCGILAASLLESPEGPEAEDYKVQLCTLHFD